jgi:hypothetical protein
MPAQPEGMQRSTDQSMRVRIYQPSKTAMQSGRAGTRQWVLEFEPESRTSLDPLMGWTSSRNTRTQVRMSFETLEEAVAYAEKQGYAYAVQQPQARTIRPKSYSDNFRYDRIGRWTH